MSTNDGGPAFPRAPFDVNDYTGDGSEGMSLRDWFAGQAMAAMVGSCSKINRDTHEDKVGDGVLDFTSPDVHAVWDGIDPGSHTAITKAAYLVADAMIAVRNGGAK